MKRNHSLPIALLMALCLATACRVDTPEPTPQGPSTDTPSTGTTSTGTDTLTTPSEGNGKTLVAYFSRANYVPEGTDAVSGATNKTRNTQTVAIELARLTGADLFEIVPERDYPVSHTDCSQIALQEYEDDARPALRTHVENMADYDTIYIGFPIWRYCEPMAIRTFVEEYDFAGKTICPFCTSMAVSIDDARDDIIRLCPEATVTAGLRIPYTIPDNLTTLLTAWLDTLKQ